VASGTFEAQDHEYPALLEIRLRVTDGGGLSDTASVTLQPQTTDVTFLTQPSGLELTVGSGVPQVTPFTHRMIVGGRTSVSAPLVQVLNGVSYEFVGWTDAPDANRQIVAGAEPATYTAQYEATGQVSTTYLSDLPFSSETNGWGPVERDRSNGEQAGGDGRPITLNGVTYAKGLGVHALSDVRLVVPADCTRLLAAIGIDDESASLGSVSFEIYTGTSLRYASPVMTGSSATQLVDVAVTSGQTLRLVATNGGDNIDYDHADWADARFLCGAGTEPPPNQAPSLTQPANQSHVEGAAVSLQLAASDPDADALAYAATGLPPGVSVNAATGLISGSIAAGAAGASPYTVVASVDDGRGGTDSRTFTWTVTLPAPAPAPTGLAATPTTVDMRLMWDAVPAASGYDVYRASAADGPYEKLNASPLTTAAYRDTSAPRGTSHYRVIAIVNGTPSLPASVAAVRQIHLVGASSGASRTSSTLQLDVPPAPQVGDLMIATVTTAAASTITAPPGWTAVRTDTSGQALRQVVFSRLVANGDPTSFSWTLSQAVATVGTIEVYRGVDTVSPIEANTGRVNAASSSIQITPASSASPHAVAFVAYAVAWNATITAPQVIIDHVGVGTQRGNSRVAVRVGDRVMPAPGTTGPMTAASSKSSVSIGQVIVLRPATP
jgi:hypothetical protein